LQAACHISFQAIIQSLTTIAIYPTAIFSNRPAARFSPWLHTPPHPFPRIAILGGIAHPPPRFIFQAHPTRQCPKRPSANPR